MGTVLPYYLFDGMLYNDCKGQYITLGCHDTGFQTETSHLMESPHSEGEEMYSCPYLTPNTKADTQF